MKSIVQHIDGIPLRTLFWASPLLFAVHNIEETLSMEGWTNGIGSSMHEPVTTLQFGFAVGFLTLLVIIFTVLCINSEKDKIGAYLLTCIVLSFLINAIFPHIFATIYLGAYMPGVVTSLVLYLPFSLYMLRRIFREGYIKSKLKFIFTIIVAVVLIKILIPVSLHIGLVVSQKI